MSVLLTTYPPTTLTLNFGNTKSEFKTREREPPLLPKHHFKPQDTVFLVTLVLIFAQKSVYSGEKRSLESRIFVFKFPGRRHLE